MYEEKKQTEILKLSAETGQEACSDEFLGAAVEKLTHFLCQPSTTTTTTYEDDTLFVLASSIFAGCRGKGSHILCVRLKNWARLLGNDENKKVVCILTRMDALHKRGLATLSEGHIEEVTRALRTLAACGCLDVINTPARDPRTAPLLFFLRRELVTLPEKQLRFFALKPEAREMFLRCAPLFEEGLDPAFLDRLKNYKRDLVTSHERFAKRQAEGMRRPSQRDLNVRGSGRWLPTDDGGNFIELKKPRGMNMEAE